MDDVKVRYRDYVLEKPAEETASGGADVEKPAGETASASADVAMPSTPGSQLQEERDHFIGTPVSDRAEATKRRLDLDMEHAGNEERRGG